MFCARRSNPSARHVVVACRWALSNAQHKVEELARLFNDRGRRDESSDDHGQLPSHSVALVLPLMSGMLQPITLV